MSFHYVGGISTTPRITNINMVEHVYLFIYIFPSISSDSMSEKIHYQFSFFFLPSGKIYLKHPDMYAVQF